MKPVRNIEPINHTDPLWRTLYEESPHAHFFQSPDWSRILTTHFGRFVPKHLLFGNNGNPYILPLIEIHHCKGLLKSFCSLPLGSVGGALTRDGRTTPDYAALFKSLRKNNVLKCALVSDAVAGNADLQGGIITVLDKAVMPLDMPYATMEAKRFSANKRKLVHRGRNRGVIVSAEKFPGICEEYCALQQRVQKEKNWKTAFSSDCMRDILALAEARLFTARHQDKLACGVLCFEHNQRATAWQAVLDRSNSEALHAQAMNFLYASIFKYYCEREYTEVDLGASLGIESLEQFKNGFGLAIRPQKTYAWLHPLYAPYYRAVQRKMRVKKPDEAPLGNAKTNP
ncbi:MAG: GNAT family N-acetyltransferase [Chitinivibrionales bacterium]|nr:GNAT family N-acetyltransferase [Chitinivibrionales bacterium]